MQKTFADALAAEIAAQEAIMRERIERDLTIGQVKEQYPIGQSVKVNFAGDNEWTGKVIRYCSDTNDPNASWVHIVLVIEDQEGKDWICSYDSLEAI